MYLINKIPRGLQVLLVMAVLAILIWQLAANTIFFYYAVAGAVLITFGVIVLVYKPFNFPRKSKKEKSSVKKTDTEAPETIEVEQDYTDTPSILRTKPVTPFVRVPGKPGALNPGSNYVASNLSGPPAAVADMEAGSLPASDSPAMAANPSGSAQFAGSPSAPSIPLVDDETSLTEEDKNQLVNAVWYRCENPYCKYTSFLGVHHIVDEKEGGSNRLDNLIVLCPYCHDLAHHREIPEAEMRDWITNRENRFRHKPDWKYF
ncbi:MAG TPA: HNH endonuclease signature motif containing protein [Dehalococcoidales bacterium]|nr:HNH endonuclease signature motif containing protein [Dehalococcoidales bacterium]